MKNFILAKKNVDKDEKKEYTDSEDSLKIIQDSNKFDPTVFAYSPVWNPDRKRFDMYKISIDSNTDKHKLERIELKHDSENRAIAEMQQFYAQDLIERMKSKK